MEGYYIAHGAKKKKFKIFSGSDLRSDYPRSEWTGYGLTCKISDF